MSDLLRGLNEEQKSAVAHIDGPLLVIAGAGSGKTRVLTHRIANLIAYGIPGESILAVTFTNKAANEMKERVKHLLNDFDALTGLPLIGTFHSVCVRFLRTNIHHLGLESSFVIYDTADQEALMKTIIRDKNLNEKTFAPKAILSKISQAKNQLIEPSDFIAKAVNQFMFEAGECYREYQNRLKMSGALDFDDIIMKTIELFRKFPNILEKYQDLYKYIMIDEYQDTNYAQYVLVDMLAKKYKNIMVVGDSDQSIYGFRGASAGNILDFEKHFPGTKRVVLATNYRSQESILNIANAVIEKNSARHKKVMTPVLLGGDKVALRVFDTQRDEALGIAESIVKLKETDTVKAYLDFAVLYRTNAQSRVMEEAFIRYGIPYKIVGGVKFYSRKEIKDVLGYLRVINNPNDSVSLLRIINTPARKIGAKTLEVVRDVASKLSMSLFDVLSGVENISELAEIKKEPILKFVALIEDLKNKANEFNVASLLKYLLVETGYKEYLLSNDVNEDDDHPGDGQSRLENVHELISVASKYNELEPHISLVTFLEEVSLIADIDTLNAEDNAVVLMTIHSAKGLEFENVFITGLEDGLFPHFNSLTSLADIEEERRLLYVAVTRAKKNLTLSYARSRMYYGDNRQCVPSQFLKEIPPELLDGDTHLLASRGISFSSKGQYTQTYRPLTPLNTSINTGATTSDVRITLNAGDKISHKAWGEGTVMTVTGGIVTVMFKNSDIGKKTLAINVAPISKVS